MDDSPVISKGERKETNARLETGVFLVGGGSAAGSTGERHERVPAQTRRLMQ